jgi:hypothetical protein
LRIADLELRIEGTDGLPHFGPQSEIRNRQSAIPS